MSYLHQRLKQNSVNSVGPIFDLAEFVCEIASKQFVTKKHRSLIWSA